MISQHNIGNITAVAEYNANNAWIYNGTNGTLNNNNKYNNNRVRFLDSQSIDIETLESYQIPLHKWYDYLKICKKRKSNKPSYLYFEVDLAKWMRHICFSVNNMEYMPEDGICFVITYPRLREVIAADFSFRIVQTYYANTLTPLFERFAFHPDSYACRKGKGGLRAVQQLQEYIFDESLGFTKDIYLVKIDFQGFFMGIDTNISSGMVCDFIKEHIVNEPIKNILLYLTRIIYQGSPQMHCHVQSSKELFDALPDNKKMLGKDNGIGVAIGNVTSQMLSCFYTSLYLTLLSQMGYKFVFYTDDTVVIIHDKDAWRNHIRYIEAWLWETLRIRLHPDKRYIQHYSKGVEFLGYKLRFDRVLPSDRIVHNYRWKVQKARRKLKGCMSDEIEHFQQTVNSYNGLLKWCNSHRLRKDIMNGIRDSKLANYYIVAENNMKINIKKEYTKTEQYRRLNIGRKRQWNSQRY